MSHWWIHRSGLLGVLAVAVAAGGAHGQTGAGGFRGSNPAAAAAPQTQGSSARQGTLQQGTLQQGTLQQGSARQGSSGLGAGSPQGGVNRQPQRTAQAPRQGGQGPAAQAGPAPQVQGLPPVPAPRRGLAPQWAPLPAEHQAYIDKVLEYWEYRNDKVKVYSCQFTSWVYDPVFVPFDEQTRNLPAKEIATGEIKYAAPDKALYKESQVYIYKPATKPGEKYSYDKKEGEQVGKHWVCDGASIFEFDYPNQKLRKTILPASVQGSAIADNGPLPFLFGAKADKIKQRYWIRAITPQGVEDEYHLEAYPRHQGDAANFLKVHVIIDKKDYLPKALIIFDRNFREGVHPARTTFQFTKRQVNPFNVANVFPWRKDFYDIRAPKGFETLVERVPDPAAAPQAARPELRQGQRPPAAGAPAAGSPAGTATPRAGGSPRAANPNSPAAAPRVGGRVTGPRNR